MTARAPLTVGMTRPEVSAAPSRDRLRAAVAAGKTASSNALILIFLIGLIVPISFSFGPVRISVYRFVILLVFLPAVLAWISGRLGGVKTPDVFLLVAALWSMMALVITTPNIGNAIEPAGAFFVEFFGAYIFARYVVRDKRGFRFLVKALFVTIVFLLPFAIMETQTDHSILIALFSKIGPTIAQVSAGARLGLHRAQVVFDHPILFGTFVSSALGMVLFAYKERTSRLSQGAKAFIVLAASICSVSTGAIVTIVAQFIAMGWRWATSKVKAIKRPWRLFFILFILAYITIDLLSNRTPFHVFVSYLTLNSFSAYTRIQIFQFASQDVWNNPVFGIGLRDWTRPIWMHSSSMDNFWLFIAVRYGFIAFLLMCAGFYTAIRRIALAPIHDPDIRNIRTGFLISLAGMIIAATTVHYWNAIFSYFMFLLGAGIWMVDAEGEPETNEEPEDAAAEARPRTLI